MRRVAVALVAATLGAAAAAPATHADTTDAQRLANAEQHERAGDLDGAYAQLAALAAPTRAQRVHAAHVRRAASAVAAAAALRRSGEDAQARATLDAALTGLDSVGDAVIRADLVARSDAAARRVTKAAAAARRDVDAQAMAAIAKGGALAAKHDWDAAAAVYRSVATKPAGSIDETLRHHATAAQLRAEAEAVDATQGSFATFWTDAWHRIRTILEWLVLPIALGLVLILRHAWLWRHPGDGVALKVVDASDAMKDRRDRDDMLAAALRDAMEDTRGGGYVAGASYLDERRDLDGMAPPPVSGVSGDGSLGDLSDELEIDVAGVVRVSPLAFIPVLKRYVARPAKRTLCGTLRADDAGAELCLALHDLRPEDGAAATGTDRPGPWLATSNETLGARAVVIREVAQKYVVESGYSYISTSWRSYAGYRKGLAALLDADDDLPPRQRRAKLELARSEFEQALSTDQANLLARMRLGSVLRSMGRNPEAAAQFRRLVEDVLDVRRLPRHANELVRSHPELLYFATLDAAVSLDKWSNRDRFPVTETLAFLVGKLVVAGDGVPDVCLVGAEPAFVRGRWPARSLEGADRLRLLVVTLAAWSVSLLPRSQEAPDEEDRALAAVATQLDDVCQWIVAVDSEEPAVAIARRQAEATMRNAIARVARERRQWDAAREEAEQALVLSPHLGDAHITLAHVAMRDDRRHRDDWSSEAERHLMEALRISPDDARARFLLGELYEEIGEDRRAIAHFAKLPMDPEALFRIGRIHEQDGNLREAVVYYVRSQVRGPSHGRRAVTLLGAVRRLDEEQPRGWMLAHEGNVAVATAERMVACEVDPAAREAASEHLGEVRAEVRALVANAPRGAVVAANGAGAGAGAY